MAGAIFDRARMAGWLHEGNQTHAGGLRTTIERVGHNPGLVTLPSEVIMTIGWNVVGEEGVHRVPTFIHALSEATPRGDR